MDIKIKQFILDHFKDFKFPLVQTENEYYPNYIKVKLNSFISFYKENILGKNIILNDTEIFNNIQILSNGIVSCILDFYEGKIFEATATFNRTLEEILFDQINLLSKIPLNSKFYRARKNDKHQFVKEDLFHIDFQSRHLVSTNRYSVPGFPALYLADTTYTCWEEFDRYRLRELWFSRIENQRDLKIIKFERIHDFLNEMEINPSMNHHELFGSYLLAFPLTIACTVKAQFPHGNFKPEYIISQLLLQYISKNDTIDGIKFPSSKINYDDLINVKCYNYVFPVKKITEKGYCEKLMETFFITQPTSLELEEIIFNPSSLFGRPSTGQKGIIKLIKNKEAQYEHTSFGKLESCLNRLQLEKI